MEVPLIIQGSDVLFKDSMGNLNRIMANNEGLGYYYDV